MRTFSLTVSASMPRSTKNSSAFGDFCSSSRARCGGLRAGWSAPRSVSPSAVVTRTLWETMLAGSWPPRVCRRTKPLSSMCLTKKPISSVWAATITRPSPLPFFVPITLPRASVRTSSVREPSSSRAISRCRSSRPGTPGVSINRLSSASFSAMLFLSTGYARSLTTAHRRVKVAEGSPTLLRELRELEAILSGKGLDLFLDRGIFRYRLQRDASLGRLFEEALHPRGGEHEEHPGRLCLRVLVDDAPRYHDETSLPEQ